jgi:hypothetical protein
VRVEITHHFVGIGVLRQTLLMVMVMLSEDLQRMAGLDV